MLITNRSVEMKMVQSFSGFACHAHTVKNKFNSDTTAEALVQHHIYLIKINNSIVRSG